MAEVYSQQNVTITIDGGNVITGLGEGDDVVTAERNTEKRERTVGADGTVVINETADDTGTITITLKQTSPFNAFLRQLYNSTSSFDVHITDNNLNAADIDCAECYVMNLPPKNNGESVSEREWEIIAVDYNENQGR